MAKKVPLIEWASKRYDPAPPISTLRRWAREGRIYPKPELVGKTYYCLENAERKGVPSPHHQPIGVPEGRVQI